MLGLVGCASNDLAVSSTFDPLSPFPAQATYVWDEASNSGADDPAIRELELDALIKAVADEEFAARGYRPVVSTPSDYRLSYQLAVHRFIAADAAKSIGSLSLQLVKSDSGHRVWLGFGRAEVYVGLTVAERRERLRKAIARMLEKFPPSQRPE